MPQYLEQNWPIVRQFPRQNLEAPLKVTCASGTSCRGWCNNIGEGGLGATLAAELKAGDEVAMEFTLPSAPEPLQVKGVVRHAKGFRYGLEFLTLSPSQRQMICEYVATGPPERRKVRRL